MNLLKSEITFFLIILFFCNVESALHASAESTIQCHILATSFNSLLSKYFGIPKKQIIMIKMGEKVAQDDLLISLKIAKITGEEISRILGLRRSKNTWADIVSGLPQLLATVNNADLLELKLDPILVTRLPE